MSQPYIEETVEDLTIGCLYLERQPGAGPKFDYKLRWFERFAYPRRRARETRYAVVLAAITTCATRHHSLQTERWWTMRCSDRRSRRLHRRSNKAGPTLCVAPSRRTLYTFWDYFRNAYGRDAGLRIDHLLLNARAAPRLRAAGVDRHVRGWERRAITRRRGLSFASADG